MKKRREKLKFFCWFVNVFFKGDEICLGNVGEKVCFKVDVFWVEDVFIVGVVYNFIDEESVVIVVFCINDFVFKVGSGFFYVWNRDFF